jgi:hypothetical protein
MKQPEVLHSKLPLQDSDGATQKLRTGCDQNNIINIKEQIYHVWAATEDEERHVRLCSDMSDFASMNPREVRYVANQLYQARGACFSPYKDLFRRQTKSGLAGLAKPMG